MGGGVGCIQPLDVSTTNLLKVILDRSGVSIMIAQSDSKMKLPSKFLHEWIKAAQDKIQAKNMIIKTSFLGT